MKNKKSRSLGIRRVKTGKLETTEKLKKQYNMRKEPSRLQSSPTAPRDKDLSLLM